MTEVTLTEKYIWIKYKHYEQVFTDASKGPQNGQVEATYVIPRLDEVVGKEYQIIYQCLHEN